MADVPLSERIEAPATVMPNVEGLTWRAATLDDLDALTVLQRAIDLADHPNYATTRDELEEELSHSYVDLERDSLVARDVHGVTVAYGTVELSPGQETIVRSFLYGGVHPEHRGRGIGRELIAWQQSRALQQLAGSPKTLPGWICGNTDERDPATARLLARSGFMPTRWFISQLRDLAQDIPVVDLPPGITLVPYSTELSDAIHVAKNEAFRDHWSSQPTTDEQWSSMTGLDSFHAGHSSAALAPDGSVAGFLITFVVEDDWELQGFSSGYVALLGVVREWRRKGIAPALLAHAMRAYRDAGFEKAELDVDSDNPSGALGMYTGMGFVEQHRSVAYLKVF
jgi:mycothiol synthase